MRYGVNVDREGGLHRGVLVKIVENDFRVAIPFQLDHDEIGVSIQTHKVDPSPRVIPFTKLLG